MSAFSARQIHLVLFLYQKDGRIDSYECTAPNGTPIWTVYSKHLPDGQASFTKAKLVNFLRSIGELS